MHVLVPCVNALVPGIIPVWYTWHVCLLGMLLDMWGFPRCIAIIYNDKCLSTWINICLITCIPWFPREIYLNRFGRSRPLMALMISHRLSEISENSLQLCSIPCPSRKMYLFAKNSNICVLFWLIRIGKTCVSSCKLVRNFRNPLQPFYRSRALEKC